MPSAGFEPAIPVRKWQQTYALDRTATGLALVLTTPPAFTLERSRSETKGCRNHGKRCVQRRATDTGNLYR